MGKSVLYKSIWLLSLSGYIRHLQVRVHVGNLVEILCIFYPLSHHRHPQAPTPGIKVYQPIIFSSIDIGIAHYNINISRNANYRNANPYNGTRG